MEGIACGQFIFYNDFDSANLARVQYVPPEESAAITKPISGKNVIPETYDAEFNIWTKPDCYGTEFENGNRTWFYFGLRAPAALMNIRFNLVDLNRQGKMYSQGMAPVFRVLPGRPKWDRILDRPTYSTNNDIFTLSFKFRTPENIESTMYFAFTYPFSYVELEKMLVLIDHKFLSMDPVSEEDIYYVREPVCFSLEGRRVDLITISSWHGITLEREPRISNLFPDKKIPRPHKFVGKKVIFVSARVHPGETPSSFVFNGFLSLLTNRDDLIAQQLRKLYVFKMIPFLNPDGVARGHYRTDTRGANLNRVYLNPSEAHHPSVYAARALIRYYHYGCEKEDVIPICDLCQTGGTLTDGSATEEEDGSQQIDQKVSHMSLGDGPSSTWCTKWHNFCRNCGARLTHTTSKEEVLFERVTVGAHGDVNSNESSLFLYLDLHGHASKKGIFMYGNHFEDVDRNVECMLLPKLMSINNHHFHFNSCNFTERNMYLRDKRDGMSRAGSGRVAVLSTTGIIKSYTLECNYNSGRLVNVLPPTTKEPCGKMHTLPVPPKYTPLIFEEVGKSLGGSILDLTGQNPCSRLPNSEFHSLSGLRDWLRQVACDGGPEQRKQRGRTLRNQGKTRGVVIKSRPPAAKTVQKKQHPKPRGTPIPLDRKENLSASKTLIRLNKSKSRKDLTLKSKNAALPVANRGKKPVIPPKPKLKSIQENPAPKDTDSVHLQEICFIKHSDGKAIVASYKSKDDGDLDDKLVVTWDASSSRPQLYTQMSKTGVQPGFNRHLTASEPSTSKQGQFRVHNFAKVAMSKNRMKKTALRRLASATDVVAKVEKKKKKLKAK